MCFAGDAQVARTPDAAPAGRGHSGGGATGTAPDASAGESGAGRGGTRPPTGGSIGAAGTFEAGAGSSGDPGIDAGANRDPTAHYVAPYIVYVGEPRSVRVFGKDLDAADGRPVYVDDMQVGSLIAVSAGEGRLTLPGLPGGEHFLQIDGAASEARPGARIFAAERTRYEDADLVVPCHGAVEYDPERNAFFGLFGQRFARLQFDGAKWQLDEVDLPAPGAFTMTADGRELLVTNVGCALAHVNPDTLALGPIESTPCPLYPYEGRPFGILHALADGRILLGSEWYDSISAQLRDYPSLQPVATPSLSDVFAILSPDKTRMIWAESNSISRPHSIYVYDVDAPTFRSFRTLGGDAYGNNMRLSADGWRFMHDIDVYDRDFNFLGSLDTSGLHFVGISGDGTVAIAYNTELATLRAYDISGAAGPFPALGGGLVLTEELGWASRVLVDDDGQTAFAFTIRNVQGNVYECRFLLRHLLMPAAAPAGEP